MEDVYMDQPKGFVNNQTPHYVCKLTKALYGLKQAPRAWFENLKLVLQGFGFHNSQSDTSLFILKSAEAYVLFLVYVDDILVTGYNLDYIARLIQQLNSIFSFKDTGELHYFSGAEVQRHGSAMILTQMKYISDLLKVLDLFPHQCAQALNCHSMIVILT